MARLSDQLAAGHKAGGILRIPGPGHLAWWLKPARLAILMLLAVFLGGTAGYVLIEGWTPWDAFYMTVISVTTVGYNVVRPLSHAGEVFTVFLLIGGVGTVFYTITLAVAGVVESGFHHRWETRRKDRMIDELTKHFIICGYGRIGRIIVDEFRKEKVPYIVIDRDPDRVHEVMEQGGLAVVADASNEDTLRRVGIGRARALIAVAGTDAENVYIILSARLMRPDCFIIGRAETEETRRRMQRAGADRVISPYQLGGHQIAQTALRPAVVDFVQLATSAQPLDLALEQIRVEQGGGLENISLITANLRQRFGVIVVAIQRSDGRMEFNPAPDLLMRGGDQMLVLGRPEGLKELELVAQLPPRTRPVETEA